MSHLIRTLSAGLLLMAATVVSAQTNPLSGGSSYSPAIKTLHTKPLVRAIGPGPAAPVTPVPEPSEWAMMLAGMALVGFIVRRNARR